MHIVLAKDITFEIDEAITFLHILQLVHGNIMLGAKNQWCDWQLHIVWYSDICWQF